MKRLIIFFAILLFSSPAIGEETGVLYLYESYSGYVWKKFGDEETNPKYKGVVLDGKPHGIGSLIFPKGGKYEGDWKNGERHGQGTFTWSDGIKYVGGWKDGKYTNGTGFDKDRNIIGKWVNGVKQ